jgi:hypothetical protein
VTADDHTIPPQVTPYRWIRLVKIRRGCTHIKAARACVGYGGGQGGLVLSDSSITAETQKTKKRGAPFTPPSAHLGTRPEARNSACACKYQVAKYWTGLVGILRTLHLSQSASAITDAGSLIKIGRSRREDSDMSQIKKTARAGTASETLEWVKWSCRKQGGHGGSRARIGMATWMVANVFQFGTWYVCPAFDVHHHLPAAWYCTSFGLEHQIILR